MSEHTDKALQEMGKSSGFREHVAKTLFGSDFISRQAAIDVVSEACFELRGVFGRCEDALKDLPSAYPEPQWIPCSETVDIPDHEIMACDKYGEEMFGYLAHEDEQWLCESDGCMMYDPIAWREKPEPYQVGGTKHDQHEIH